VAVPLVVAAGLGVAGFLLVRYWMNRPSPPPPVLVVEAAYPGASPEEVAATVAAPIEQQIDGVEGLLYLASRCGNDGSYTLTVAFRPGMDLNVAQVLVQNRVAMAQPTLPEVVKQAGVKVMKGSLGVLMLIVLSSPDGSRDTLYLSHLADREVRPTLTCVPDVADVVCLGQRESRLHVRLDRKKMAAADTGAVALANGRPAVVLAVHAGRQASAALQDVLTRLNDKLPQGVALDAGFDFSAELLPGSQPSSEYLLLDLAFPESASPRQVARGLQRCSALLRDQDGVRDVLALSENPFDRLRDRPCLLVRLTPAGERQDVRVRLAEVPDLLVRVRDRVGPYPIDLAVHGPEAEQVRQFAARLADRLARSEDLSDVWADRAMTPRPRIDVSIDRAKATRLGLSLEEISSVLPPMPERVEDLQGLKVRNDQGEVIPLATVAQLRQTEAPAALTRFNGQPMVEITANAASGSSPRALRELCEREAEAVRQELGLPADYRLGWLR
jgi:multidrug efflux pump subunit AcrB